MNSSRLDNRVERVIIVNTEALLETFCNKTGFVAINLPICFILNVIEPFAIYQIQTKLGRNQSPSLVLH
jgi:hypothetical protein